MLVASSFFSAAASFSVLFIDSFLMGVKKKAKPIVAATGILGGVTKVRLVRTIKKLIPLNK